MMKGRKWRERKPDYNQSMVNDVSCIRTKSSKQEWVRGSTRGAHLSDATTAPPRASPKARPKARPRTPRDEFHSSLAMLEPQRRTRIGRTNPSWRLTSSDSTNVARCLIGRAHETDQSAHCDSDQVECYPPSLRHFLVIIS